jgi:hypothetical protein
MRITEEGLEADLMGFAVAGKFGAVVESGANETIMTAAKIVR